MPLDSTHIIELDGVVIPTQWDRRGTIIQVAIQTKSFEKYLVDTDSEINLLKRIDQHIRVRGAVTGEDVNGLLILNIYWIDKHAI